MYLEGEVPYVSNNNGYGNNSGFGNNGWEALIGLAIIAALFGGGFGFGGNRGGNCATQADLASGFSTNTIQRGIDDILLNQSNNLNFINQGFSGLNTQILNGFHGVDNAICTLGYQNQMGFNQLGNQLASCCCDIRQQMSDCCCRVERQIDGVNYNMAKNTCDIIRSSQDNTRAILDYLTNEKIEGLRAENTALKGQISNDRQTNTIVSALSPKAPVPAYPVFPATSFAHPTGVAFGWGGNNNECCGCNNF